MEMQNPKLRVEFLDMKISETGLCVIFFSLTAIKVLPETLVRTLHAHFKS